MKRFIISLISCATLFIGCTEVTEGLDRAEVLSVSVDSIDMDAEGGATEVIITSVCSWNIDTSSLDWIDASLDEGRAGTKTLTINLSENLTPEERSGTIVVRTKYDEFYHEITVKQGAAEPYITFESSEFSADVEGSTFSIPVLSNIEWTATCDAGWVSVTPNKGDSTTTAIKVVVAKSLDTKSRNATIIVKNTIYGVTQTISILQEAFNPAVTISKESFDVGSDATSLEATIDSNIEWEATCEVNWVTIAPANGKTGTTTLKLSVAKNDNTEPRSAKVKVVNKKYNIVREVSISQSATDFFINLSEASFTIGSEGDNRSVEVKSNTEWEATCEADWVTIVTANGEAGTTSLKFSVAKNKSTESRSATIEVAGKNCDVVRKIDISQDGIEPSIVLSKDSYSFTSSSSSSININVDSNIEWEAICEADWVTITPSNGEAGKTNIKISVTQNKSTESRSATIEVAGKTCDFVREISISQAGFAPRIDISRTSYTLDSNSSTLSISISANVDWTATCDANWVTCSKTNSILSLSVSDNIGTARNCDVVISNDEYNISKSITIKQSGNNYVLRYTADAKIDFSAIEDDLFGLGWTSFDDDTTGHNWEYGAGEIYLKSTITTIPEYAFYDSSVTSVTIPSGKTTIGSGAFCGCISLESITIPSSVTEIGDSAFNSCSSLKSITIPDGITIIYSSTFGYCSSLESITIPSSVTEIGDGAFSSCSSLKSITIPSGVTSIGYSAFSDCSSLTSITIPSGVTSIGGYAFSGCSSLTSITIPSGVTSIGGSAFSDCSSLTSITIPSGVTSIGYSAFNDCSSLESVYCKATTPPTCSWGAFNNNASGRKIYVPTDAAETYKAAYGWKNYADDIEGYNFN